MNGMRKFLAALGGIASLSWQTLRAIFRRPFEGAPLTYQMDHAGLGSWSITLLTSIFTGMVMALQFINGLKAYGGEIYTGKLVALGIFRELGPTLTALLVGGRVGSGIAAELGSMMVTEQVDAIRALGADPVKKLVVPRVLACLVSIPMLTMLANVVGVAGGMLVCIQQLGITPKFYYNQFLSTIAPVDLYHGLIKSVFFGYTIGIVGCWVGMQTHGGTEGVGNSTTLTVVITACTILISDYVLSQFLVAVWG